jgi:hypothetical protein
MAPILSKGLPPPPRNSAEKIDRWVKQNRSHIDSIFDVLKDIGTMGRMCMGDAEVVWDSIRSKLDAACITGVRLLESLCCLDVNRFAKPERPLTGSLPVLFVLMLVVMLYNSFVFGYMPAAGIALNSKTSLLFHAWVFMLLSSFAQAVRTDPGSAPTTAKWCDKENPPPEANDRKRSSDGARWCRKSGAYKPDRAHYCRVLQKGVLRMDHYCPWLGNTVGFKNQKFFFLFLLYTNAACAQLGVSFIQLLVQYTLPALTTFCLVGAEGLTVLITSLLIPFFLFHFWLIARNTTTIEFCERMRSRGEGEDVDDSLPSRYDLGIYRNFCAVLGSNPLTWFLPVGGPSGDGINFPINPEYEKAMHGAVAAAGGAVSREQLAEASTGESDEYGPETSHPAACSPKVHAHVEQIDMRTRQSAGDIEQGGGGLCEGAESEKEASDVGSEEGASGSTKSAGGDEGFLVWRDSAEFIEDLTIGCQFLGEKAEDCTRGTLMCFLAGCIPSTWGRRAVRSLEGSRPSPWKRSLSSREAYDGKHVRSSAPAVRIVPVRGGGALSSGEGEGESCSSGYDFLSDC